VPDLPEAKQMSILPRLLVRVLAIGLSLGCQDTSSPPDEGIAFGPRASVWRPDTSAVIVHGYYSGIVNAADLVIADSVSWAATWAQISAGHKPSPSLPTVDFRTERVVLVALGQRNSGGSDIRIDSVVSFQRGSVTYVTATSPGQDCGTTAALTQPLHVIRLSPRVEPIVFQHRSVVRTCS